MKRKICLILFIMILIMSVLAIDVSALSFTASMTPSNTKIQEATEFTVTVKVSNLDVGDNGINSFSAYLSYANDVFETLSDSSVEGLNGWIAAYAPGTGKITLQKSSFVKSDEEIMQITLKTKSGIAENTKGAISLSNINASNSATEITASNISTTITVGTPTTELPTINDENTNNANTNSGSGSGTINITPNTNVNTNNANTNNSNTTNNNSTNNNSINNNAISNYNSTNNQSDEDMPYTGTESSELIKIIIGVILIALVAFIKIERLKDI